MNLLFSGQSVEVAELVEEFPLGEVVDPVLDVVDLSALPVDDIEGLCSAVALVSGPGAQERLVCLKTWTGRVISVHFPLYLIILCGFLQKDC